MVLSGEPRKKSQINRYIYFHSRTLHLDIIKVFYSPTDAQVNCLKNNFTIDIKTASMSNALPDDGVTAPKHVGAVLMPILM